MRRRPGSSSPGPHPRRSHFAGRRESAAARAGRRNAYPPPLDRPRRGSASGAVRSIGRRDATVRAASVANGSSFAVPRRDRGDEHRALPGRQLDRLDRAARVGVAARTTGSSRTCSRRPISSAGDRASSHAPRCRSRSWTRRSPGREETVPSHPSSAAAAISIRSGSRRPRWSRPRAGTCTSPDGPRRWVELVPAVPQPPVGDDHAVGRPSTSTRPRSASGSRSTNLGRRHGPPDQERDPVEDPIAAGWPVCLDHVEARVADLGESTGS